ncbi:hypothetical protein TIFTF001_022009 [Ficus carica]|uniref:Uncharacterized protein n=1 Tax=Ficus carica TaxID=3494 RepID=A0AA88ABP3_FICCA|nr:hypothetical protein TIFTF001_022009 [Ficus carica]
MPPLSLSSKPRYGGGGAWAWVRHHQQQPQILIGRLCTAAVTAASSVLGLVLVEVVPGLLYVLPDALVSQLVGRRVQKVRRLALVDLVRLVARRRPRRLRNNFALARSSVVDGFWWWSPPLLSSPVGLSPQPPDRDLRKSINGK